LLADKFIKASKLKIEKIPYKGAAELATALLTGDLQLSFFAYSAGAPFLKDGKLKPIAIASNERSPLTPDIATFKELGMQGVVGDSWVALFARADTPKPVIARLQAIITQASKDPDYVSRIRIAGNDPWVIEPDKMNDFIKADFKFWEPDLRQIEPQ
jgi:tripartite-type tricarboxylate transporter receptor subunit TctC